MVDTQDFDFHNTVLRAASRTDFISRLYQEFGRPPVQLNDSGVEADRTSFGEANELIKNILDDGPAAKGRPSMEQISTLLMEYVGEEIKQEDVQPMRRPSAEEVQYILRNFLMDNSDLMKEVNEILPALSLEVPHLPALIPVSPTSPALSQTASPCPPSDPLYPRSASWSDYSSANSSMYSTLSARSPATNSSSSYMSSPGGLSTGYESFASPSSAPSSPKLSHHHHHAPRSPTGGSKKHTCSFCHKSFGNSSNLNRHLRIHTGSKPYLCEFCSTAFNNSSNRRKHEKTCCKRQGADLQNDQPFSVESAGDSS